ncbi:hypothetical protein GPECTOR_129g562 [Gonium pectorale]|uniref:Uncharacterized protein n=1 Tax=Gonium pectorale TaxID=33097 RepID=A0A150FYD9_GONPE|nr:hypothetical protein GPECTOR_129g562 [Gonium pectorale]|eukprot:KXZ42632.1 hypothetical protein GPECTOR_129g562 [Gonium pectorale]
MSSLSCFYCECPVRGCDKKWKLGRATICRNSADTHTGDALTEENAKAALQLLEEKGAWSLEDMKKGAPLCRHLSSRRAYIAQHLLVDHSEVYTSWKSLAEAWPGVFKDDEAQRQRREPANEQEVEEARAHVRKRMEPIPETGCVPLNLEVYGITGHDCPAYALLTGEGPNAAELFSRLYGTVPPLYPWLPYPEETDPEKLKMYAKKWVSEVKKEVNLRRPLTKEEVQAKIGTTWEAFMAEVSEMEYVVHSQHAKAEVWGAYTSEEKANRYDVPEVMLNVVKSVKMHAGPEAIRNQLAEARKAWNQKFNRMVDSRVRYMRRKRKQQQQQEQKENAAPLFIVALDQAQADNKKRRL